MPKPSYDKPEISVITAVYNRESCIRRALTSLVNQSFTFWELIAVDDGSSDDSLAILNEFSNNHKNVTVISQHHKNLSLSRNTGIEFSRGKFITFLDSDDEYLTEHLESRYNYMINNPRTDLIHGGVLIKGSAFVADRNNPNKLIHLSQCIIGATFFGKRKVYDTIGGFNELKYSEDYEFLERAIKCFTVEKVEYPTYVYHRDISDSITNKITQN